MKIEVTHGDDAPRWIAERIGALAIARDAAGIARFKAIAARLHQLLGLITAASIRKAEIYETASAEPPGLIRPEP